MNIYKFTKNTVELSQYYKNIDSIRSIIIIGNTCGLCGWFKLIENDKWEELVPDPDLDASSDAGYINIKRVFPTLINNKAEIVIVCDNEDTKTYWETVYHYFCVLMDKEEIRNFKMIDSIKENKDYETVMKDIKTTVEKRKHKFDVGFINAPYDGKLHEKFESMMFDLCNDEIVWVGPTAWLLGKSQSKVLTTPVDKYYTEVHSIQGCDYFDAGISGNMGITYVNKNMDNHNIIFDGNVYGKCSDVKHYSNDALLTAFYNILDIHNIQNNLHVHVKRTGDGKAFPSCEFIEAPDMNQYVYRTKAFSGHSNARSKEIGEFWAFTSNATTYNECCGQYKRFIDKTDRNGNAFCQYFIPFNNEVELKGFWNYCHSIFFNICLYSTKLSLNLDKGELKTVPWFDFSDPMFAGSPEDIDVALFRKYGISQQIVDHILEILPNYYNLDLTKYKYI